MLTIGWIFIIAATRWGLNGIAGAVGTRHGCDSSTVNDGARVASNVVTIWRDVI